MNEEQKKQYNLFRSVGLDDATALQSVNNLYTGESSSIVESGADNILTGENSLLSSIKKGVKTATIDNIDKTSDAVRGKSVWAGIPRAGVSLIGGVGKGVGEIFGGVAETLDDVTGEVVSGAFEKPLEAFAESEVGQSIGRGIQNLDIATDGVSTDVLDALNLLGIAPAGKVVSSTARLVSKPALAGAKLTADVLKTGTGKAVTGTRKLGDYLKNGKIKKDDLGEIIPENVLDPKTGVVEGGSGLSALKKNKLDIGDKNFLIKSFTPAEGKSWIETFKKSEGVGKHFEESVPAKGLEETKDIFNEYVNVNKKAGSEIAEINKKLEKGVYSLDELKTSIEPKVDDFLSKSGYKYDPIKKELVEVSKFADLEASDLNTLQKIVAGIKSTGETISGNDLNLIMKNLNAGFDKKGTSGLQKVIDKDIRAFRNSKLTEPELDTFKKYSETIEIVNDFQKAKNTDDKLNILMKKLGSASGTGSASRISKEIQRVTGKDIGAIGKIVGILSRVSKKGGVNRTALDNIIPTGVSKAGIIDEIWQYAKGKLTGNEIIDEIEKAITSSPQ